MCMNDNLVICMNETDGESRFTEFSKGAPAPQEEKKEESPAEEPEAEQEPSSGEHSREDKKEDA